MYAVILDHLAPAKYLLEENSALMYKPALPKNATEREQTEKAPLLVVKRIREAILEEVFRPGDHLGEVELAERFKVSRSPARETLLALENEGTVIISPYKGAIVKPLSVAEVLDIAELRLAVISLALNFAMLTASQNAASIWVSSALMAVRNTPMSRCSSEHHQRSSPVSRAQRSAEKLGEAGDASTGSRI